MKKIVVQRARGLRFAHVPGSHVGSHVGADPNSPSSIEAQKSFASTTFVVLSAIVVAGLYFVSQ